MVSLSNHQLIQTKNATELDEVAQGASSGSAPMRQREILMVRQAHHDSSIKKFLVVKKLLNSFQFKVHIQRKINL
jgi:hypothetical protein